MRTKHAAGDEGPCQHWHGARIPALDGLEGLCRRVLMMGCVCVCVCVWLSLHHGRSVNDVVFSKLWQTYGEDGPSFGSLHRQSVWMEMQMSHRCCIPDKIKYAGQEKQKTKTAVWTNRVLLLKLHHLVLLPGHLTYVVFEHIPPASWILQCRI